MATARFCLSLLWVVAAASAAVTPVSVARGRGLPTPGCPPARPHRGPRAQVPTPEASPSTLSLGTPQTASPRPTPAPLGDVGTPSPPAPSPEEEPTLDVTLESKEPPDTQEPGPAPEEPGTTASGSTAGAAPGTTEDPFGTLSASPSPCPGDEDPPEACGEPTGAQRAAVAEALGTFAVRFYRHMAEAAEPGANLLFSPLNVALGLSHLLLGEGLRGHRHPAWHPWVLLWVPAEPRCHLQVPGVRPRSAWLPSWATQRGCSACTEPCSSWPPCLGCWLPRRSSTTQVSRGPVGLATRMGANPAPPDAPLRCAALSLQPRFLNESERFYKALPQELSGNESLDLQRINAWVRQATRGRLPRLLAQLPPEPRLVLLSAVHFQGTPLLFGFWGCLRARCPAGNPVPTPHCPHGAVSPQPAGRRRSRPRRRCRCPSCAPASRPCPCPP